MEENVVSPTTESNRSEVIDHPQASKGESKSPTQVLLKIHNHPPVSLEFKIF